jgi:hypothetical protein
LAETLALEGAWRRTRAKIARTIRDHPDADVTELRQQLRAERLAAHVSRVVESAPPLTAEQREQIASILASVKSAP